MKAIDASLLSELFTYGTIGLVVAVLFIVLKLVITRQKFSTLSGGQSFTFVLVVFGMFIIALIFLMAGSPGPKKDRLKVNPAPSIFSKPKSIAQVPIPYPVIQKHASDHAEQEYRQEQRKRNLSALIMTGEELKAYFRKHNDLDTVKLRNWISACKSCLNSASRLQYQDFEHSMVNPASLPMPRIETMLDLLRDNMNDLNYN